MKSKRMNEMKRGGLLAATLLILLAVTTITAYAMTVEGNTRSINGPVDFTQPVKGDWQYSDGYWYFHTAEGIAKNQWLCIEDANAQRDWFCFDGRGVMCTGWQKSGSGNWYYLRETADNRQGAMERGFILDPYDGRCYYMDMSTGIMKTGWVCVEGNNYYFAESGENSLWVWDSTNAKWKSAGTGRPCGSMYRNERTPDGSYVDEQGRKV